MRSGKTVQKLAATEGGNMTEIIDPETGKPLTHWTPGMAISGTPVFTSKPPIDVVELFDKVILDLRVRCWLYLVYGIAIGAGVVMLLDSLGV